MKKYLLITVILSFFIFFCFISSKETILITKDNINIFINTLLPTLFPYMLILLLFINYKCHLLLAYLIQYISIPLFNVSGKSFSILLIGIIGGYPLLAILSKEIIDKNNKDELNKIVPLFSYPSLSFLLNIIGIKVNPIFIIIFILSSFFLLFLFKDNNKKEYLSIHDINNELKDNNNLINSLSKSIKTSINNLTIIFSNLVFFSLFKIFFKFNNNKINYILLSFFDFSKSSIYLVNEVNNIVDIIILCTILLFGGLNIISQIYIIYSNSLLNIKKYIIYRLYYILITILIIFIL